MNERLPYEEELSKQLNNLQLPEENVSWEDMQRRLEEDDDDEPIITPFQKGCLGGSLLLLLLLLAIWLMIKPTHWPWNRNEKSVISSGESDNDPTYDSVANTRIKKLLKDTGSAAILANPVTEQTGLKGKTKKGITKDLSPSNNKTTLPIEFDGKRKAVLKKYRRKAILHTNIFS